MALKFYFTSISMPHTDFSHQWAIQRFPLGPAVLFIKIEQTFKKMGRSQTKQTPGFLLLLNVRRHPNAYQLHKRCSASLIFGEMQTKAITRYHITPVRPAFLKDGRKKCSQGCGEKRTLSTAARNVNWCSSYGFFKELK